MAAAGSSPGGAVSASRARSPRRRCNSSSSSTDKRARSVVTSRRARSSRASRSSSARACSVTTIRPRERTTRPTPHITAVNAPNSGASAMPESTSSVSDTVTTSPSPSTSPASAGRSFNHVAAVNTRMKVIGKTTPQRTSSPKSAACSRSAASARASAATGARRRQASGAVTARNVGTARTWTSSTGLVTIKASPSRLKATAMIRSRLLIFSSVVMERIMACRLLSLRKM